MYGVFGRVKGTAICCLDTEDNLFGNCSHHRFWKPPLHLPHMKSCYGCFKLQRVILLPSAHKLLLGEDKLIYCYY